MNNTQDRFIPAPDFQPMQRTPRVPAPQLSVAELNRWLNQTHGEAVNNLAGRGINLGFHQDLPHHAIALRVSTDNASFAFAMPTPVPMQRFSQGEPLVRSAMERIPDMERAFSAYDAMYEGVSKHQRGQVPVHNGPLEDLHGWQLQTREGSGLGSWRECTRTTASVEDGLVDWCREQHALRLATSKDGLAKLLQDPNQAVLNRTAPRFPTIEGNACAFDLPGLATDRHAYRAYLSGRNDTATGEALMSVHLYMRDAGNPESVGSVVMEASTMELHATGVHYRQGMGSPICHDYTPDAFGVDASVAGFFIDSGVPVADLLPQHNSQAHDSFDYTVGLEYEDQAATHEFTR